MADSWTIFLYSILIYESIFLGISNRVCEGVKIHIFLFITLHLIFSFCVYYMFSTISVIILLVLNQFINNYIISCTSGKLKDLSNKIAIVTGVSEKGMGYYITKTLLEQNCKVIIACRNVKASEKLVEELKKVTMNNQIEFMELDLASIDSVKNFIKEVKKKYDKLDILFNNGILNIF
jgi:hypothetical protein